MGKGRPLCIEEREQILWGIARDDSFRLIGQRLERNASVISREVARNGGRGAYSAQAAQDRAQQAKHRAYDCTDLWPSLRGRPRTCLR